MPTRGRWDASCDPGLTPRGPARATFVPVPIPAVILDSAPNKELPVGRRSSEGELCSRLKNLIQRRWQRGCHSRCQLGLGFPALTRGLHLRAPVHFFQLRTERSLSHGVFVEQVSKGRTGASDRRPGMEAGQGARRWRRRFPRRWGHRVCSELPPAPWLHAGGRCCVSLQCCVTKHHKLSGVQQPLVLAPLHRTDVQAQGDRGLCSRLTSRRRRPVSSVGVRGSPPSTCGCGRVGSPAVGLELGLTLNSSRPASFLAADGLLSLSMSRIPANTLVTTPVGCRGTGYKPGGPACGAEGQRPQCGGAAFAPVTRSLKQ